MTKADPVAIQPPRTCEDWRALESLYDVALQEEARLFPLADRLGSDFDPSAAADLKALHQHLGVIERTVLLTEATEIGVLLFKLRVFDPDLNEAEDLWAALKRDLTSGLQRRSPANRPGSQIEGAAT